jgi:hypothetical protein
VGSRINRPFITATELLRRFGIHPGKPGVKNGNSRLSISLITIPVSGNLNFTKMQKAGFLPLSHIYVKSSTFYFCDGKKNPVFSVVSNSSNDYCKKRYNRHIIYMANCATACCTFEKGGIINE